MELHLNKRAIFVTSVQRLRNIYLVIVFGTTIIFVALGVCFELVKDQQALTFGYWAFVAVSTTAIGVVGRIYSKKIGESILKFERTEAHHAYLRKVPFLFAYCITNEA